LHDACGDAIGMRQLMLRTLEKFPTHNDCATAPDLTQLSRRMLLLSHAVSSRPAAAQQLLTLDVSWAEGLQREAEARVPHEACAARLPRSIGS
jgi:hypothetical protein